MSETTLVDTVSHSAAGGKWFHAGTLKSQVFINHESKRVEKWLLAKITTEILPEIVVLRLEELLDPRVDLVCEHLLLPSEVWLSLSLNYARLIQSRSDVRFPK